MEITTVIISVGITIGVGVASIGLIKASKYIPFAYGSSRVRAKRSMLLSSDELHSLGTLSYKDIVYRLEKKGFSELVELIDSDFREENVQRVLRNHYITSINKIRKYVPSKYRDFFMVLERRNDFDFIVSVLRSKVNPNFDRHIIKALFVESKYFTEKDLEKVESMSMDDFFRILKKTPYYKLIENFIDDIKAGNLSGFEKRLSQSYYNDLKKFGKVDSVMIAYTKVLTDIYNIRQALSFASPGFISGGTLSQTMLDKLDKSNKLKDIISALEGSKYHVYVEGSIHVIDIVRGLFKYKKAFGDKLLVRNPLSINLFIAFYIHKELELKNIRIILKLVHARFNKEDIKRAII